MSARWARRRLATGLFAVLLSPVLASFLSMPAAQAAAPLPSVTLGVPSGPLIGEPVGFDVSFVNGTGGDTGYGPYVDLRLPLGVDGNDGLTFVSATYLGAGVTSTVLTADALGNVTHPYAVDSSGAPVQIHGLAVGQKYVVLRLPFGSFTPGQPAAIVHVTTQLSNFADAGVALTIGASGGFQFGATPLNDPATDPSILGTLTTAALTPTIMRVTKHYNGPEDETATGPNYPRSYTIDVTVAPGQTVTNLIVTDSLPNTIQYLSTNSTTPISTAVLTPPTSTPGGTLSRRFASVTGTGGTDATMTFNFYVPRVDSASNPILPANTGAFNTSTDNASAIAHWVPLDTSDSATDVSAGPASHTLTDKSIAVQKSVVKVGSGPVGPDDTLEWTISVQVSDYFALDNIVVDDLLGDGTLVAGFVPTMAVAGNGYDLTAAGMNVANYTFSSPDPVTGKTAISFRVSSELGTRGHLDGRMVGGCILAGGSAPDCALHNDGATTATIVFHSIVQRTYISNPTVVGPPRVDREVVEGDTLGNLAAAYGHVLDTSTFNPTHSPANTIGDGSAAVATPGTSASISIERGTLTKTIYAINGSTSFAAPVHVSPGNTVTYRLTQTFPESRTVDFRITDYLPLPVFYAGATTFDAVADATAPATGHAKYGPSDTFHSKPGAPTPTPTFDGTANSVQFAYGDYALYPAAPSTADILFTVTVSTSPFADGLLLTNQARSQTKNAVGTLQTADAIIQITLDQPVLAIAKGVVGTDNPHGVFAPAARGPVTFDATAAPPAAGSCPRFSGGPITTATLATHPIDSNLSGVDAGDYVRFAVVVENTGHASAFAVKIRDQLPAGFVAPTNGLDMCVTDGAGAAIATTNVGGGTGLFNQGIQLVDPTVDGKTVGALAPAVSNEIANNAGTNIAVISYTLKVDTSAVPSSVVTNTATLDGYANDPGASNHLSSPLTDTATVTMAPPATVKSLTGTSLNGGTSYAVGEIVTYQLTLTIPEGTLPAARIVDTLPGGLAFVDCDATAPISASTGVSTDLSGGFADVCAHPTVGTGGQLVTFNLGTLTNADTNNNAPETITITYRAAVLNVAGNVRGTTLRNSAVLSWTGGSIGAVTAGDVTVVEPLLTVDKSASKGTGDSGDTIDYTIVVSNLTATNGANAYEVSLTDVVPTGMTLASLFTQSDGPAATISVVGGNLSATWATFPQGSSATFHFSATIDLTVTPGTVFTNTANAAWTSLPGDKHTSPQSTFNVFSTERTGSTGDTGGTLNNYRTSDSADVTVPLATVTKTMTATNQGHTTGTNVAIGEIVTYEVVLKIPEGTEPNARLVDTLPAGLAFVACDAISASSTDLHTTLGANFGSACSAPTVGGGGTPVTFPLGTITNVNVDNLTDETITITYRAVVLNVGTNVHGATLQNSAVLYWDSDNSTPSASSVTVVEPIMTLAKTPSRATADAGDAVTFTVQVRNPDVSNNATAFDVAWKDSIPAGMTYVGGTLHCAGSNCPAAPDLKDSAAPDLSATWASFPLNGTATITYQATLNSNVASKQQFQNTAKLTWTSLPGDYHTTAQSTFNTASTERTGDTLNPGGDANSYHLQSVATVAVPQPVPVKTVVTTSESGTAGTVLVEIGEIIRYRIVVVIPEGQTQNVSVRDTLPAGLRYLNDNSTKVAFVTNGAGMTSSTLSGGGLAIAGNEASTDHPTYVLPSGAISGGSGAPDDLNGFRSGDHPIFFLGTLTNSDRDDDSELVVIEFNVLVDNVAGNRSGTILSDTASLWGGATPANLGDSIPIGQTVVEPNISIAKTIKTHPIDAGDTIVYQIAISNSAAGNVSPAYEYRVTDALPTQLVAPVGLPAVSCTPTSNGWANASSGASIDVTFTQIDPGVTCTITITTTVGTTESAGQTFVNTANGAYSSLPGTTGTAVGAPGNATGSANPGTSGSATGERINDGGSLNNYRNSDGVSETLGAPAIVKNDPTPASAPIGATTTYDLVVTMPEGKTRALTVTDTLHAGLTPVGYQVITTAASSGGRLSADFTGTLGTASQTANPGGPGGGAWTISFGGDVNNDVVVPVNGLANDEKFLVRITVQVANVKANQSGVGILNDAGVGYTDPQSVVKNVTATQHPTVTVIEPVLKVTKSVDVSSPHFGATVTYTLTVSHKTGSNASNADAFDVVLTDTVPTGLALQSGTLQHTTGLAPSLTPTVVGNTITIHFDSFPLGSTSTFTYQAILGGAGTVTLGQTLTNSVGATWTSLSGTVAGERTGNTGDPGGALNDYSATTSAPVTVSGIDLSLTKDDGRTTAIAGATLTYHLGYHNSGNETALGVVITETVPTGTTYTGSGWTCVDSHGAGSTAAGSTCTRTIGSVAGGASASVDFIITVVDPIPPSLTQISNTASIVYDRSHGENADPTPLNNTATDVDGIGVADLSLTKIVDDSTPDANQIVLFTIAVHNGGPDQATGVKVTDTLPGSLALDHFTVSQGSFDSSTGVWTVGTLDNGADATLKIWARTTAPGLATNAAEVTHSDQSDPDSTPGNGPGEDDYATATVTPNVADLGVTKVAGSDHPNVGTNVTFTIVATNHGVQDATGVKVSDALPSGLTFVSSDATPGTYDSGTGVWTIGSLANGASQTLHLVERVTSSATITNTATITGDQFDTNLSNNTATAAVSQLVDLLVTKVVDKDRPNVGDPDFFIITVKNLGPDTANNVLIHDAWLPTVGLTFVAAETSAGTSYVSSTGTWTVGTLANGETATLTIHVTVVGSSATTNTASVQHVDETQSDLTNDTATAKVTPPQADLAIAKAVDEQRPNTGDTDFFTITVTNAGPDAATNVVVTDLLQTGLVFDTAVSTQGTFASSTGKWSVGDLAIGGTATLTLHVIVHDPGDYHNTATVTGDQYDPDHTNNTSSVDFSTRKSDIEVIKLADRPAPTVGTMSTFTVTAKNKGPEDATQLVIHDALPAGLTYVSSAPSAGTTYDPTTGDWTIGDLAVGNTVTLAITARVVGSGTIDNTASVSHLLQRDLVPGNDSSTAEIKVPPAADLSLTKTVDVHTPDKGTNVTFTVTVTNHGPDATAGVHVRDQLPAGLTWVSDTPSVGAYNPATGDWDIGAMANGGVVTLTITATVTIEGPVTNMAEVTASSLPDPNSTPDNHAPGENDQASVPINSRGVADLSLTKTAQPTAVHKGDETTYTIVVRNAGPDAATGVIVRDQLPASVTFVGSFGGDYNPTTGAWTVGSLANGDSAALTITVRVGVAGAIVNTAVVAASDQRDPDSTNDAATAGISASGATPPPTVANTPGAAGPEPGALAPWLLGLAFALLALMASAVLASRNRAFRRRL